MDNVIRTNNMAPLEKISGNLVYQEIKDEDFEDPSLPKLLKTYQYALEYLYAKQSKLDQANKKLNIEYNQLINQSFEIEEKLKKEKKNKALNKQQHQNQQQHQPNQNIFPKSEYSFNGQLYANNISLHNQNCSKNVQRINKINTNNTYFYNRYNPSTNSLFKPNRDPQLLKYFSPYKIQNPNAQYINHRHSMSYNNLVQSNNQPLKQYIQIKNTQRQPDRNKYKVIPTGERRTKKHKTKKYQKFIE